ncbi:protein ELYS [Nematolebias whitei]|uniref:protein ELYS n=1 Tax=Nematolebias whitei TaxID=451745 RepID=UPI0018986BED|nr:protein ELYS [Nematolebias whitei]
MHNLTAQATSSLLPFSGVTLDALGEDEISLDVVLQGRFALGCSELAWLACGPHLEIVHAVTGIRLSAYCFSSGGEHPPRVLAARDFSWLKRSGLLVGLEEPEGSVLCLYDLGLSKVVKAVFIPGRITAIEPLVSYGGASTSTQHLHQSLRWFFGVAAVVTDLGHVLLVDLCLDHLPCSQSEQEASDLQVVTKTPADIPRLRESSTRQGRHLCLQVHGPSGTGVTALQYISRTNQLAVGFSNGYLQLWNMKTLKKEYNSQLEGGRVPVHAFTFQEPENDPRNCCYLWAVQSSQDLEGDSVSLHLLQLAFSERKCLASGKILYEGLEYCEERYSQDLSGTAFPLRAQTTNTRLLSCQTIEKLKPHPDRDDNMNEVASPDTSLSIFSWQVKAYGQGTPSTYIGVFDINRWYHAQMPDSLRTGESLQNCPYLAVWSLEPVVQMVSPHTLLDVVVHECSLSRGLPFTCPPPEQYFNPTTYNFDATCLLNSGVVHLTCSGHQKETLRFLKKAAPCSSDIISTSYSHCLMSGLLSSRLSDTQASSLSQEEQLDAILSTAVETSSLGLITGCIKQWTAEEQPGSALNLRYILDWAWNKVVQTKEELDGICAPLFDSSCNFTDPQTLQLLQHSQRLLSNLSAIFHCLLSEAQELTQKGLAGLMNKNMVSSLISTYAQVVLWFCHTGLLPEGSDEDALQISRLFYVHSVISNYYSIRREELTRLAKSKWCADCLMIDSLVGHCGERLTNLWKRDEGGTGQYPPPTLHALLDIYLLDNIDEATKHAIVIYLLLDVIYSFPNKDGASVESFPTAFAIPTGLVKLVQGLWLLDHHEHQSSFELLLHPAASQFYFVWQHERVLQALMCQGQQSVALQYFHVTKPPITSTSQAKLCLSVLLHNRCLTEAWCLLRQHSNHFNVVELLGFLYESCQELDLIKELLKLPLRLNEQDCLEKFLQSTGGLQNRELLMVHYLQQANYIPALQLNQNLKINLVTERDPKLKERFSIRNSILDLYGKVLPRVQRKLAMERAKPYQYPHTVHREVSRPQPLSTITKRPANEKVMSRAGFINNVLTKIEEVWLGKETTPHSSPSKTTRVADVQTSSPKTPNQALPDPFLGTPISMTSKRKSRLMDLVVHPSCHTPRPLLSPPRPPSSWVSPKSIRKAPELTLLQTPQVVKRARALAASGPVFSTFTPQSILRSSLRPTPVATPSASPGRSITPPLRSKESRITFIEDAEAPETEKAVRWTNGMAADSEISQLNRGSTTFKVACKTLSSQPYEEEQRPQGKFLPPEGGVSSTQHRCSESESSFTNEVTEEASPSDGKQPHVSLSFDTSQASVRSTDTTLEYYDAPLSEDHIGMHGPTGPDDDDDDVVTVNIKPVTEMEESEENPDATTEQHLQLLSEDAEKEEEVGKKSSLRSEELMESGPNLEANNEEKAVDSKKEQDQNIGSNNEQEDGATVDQEEPFHHEDGNQVTESSDSEIKSKDLPVKNEVLNVQPEATESSELNIEEPKPAEKAETPNEMDLEQETDLTELVEQHLFGDDLSLSRSAIHNASLNQSSFSSESLEEVEEEDRLAAADPTVFATKASASVTSSEPAGTDSHSVVSVNDSGELSSPASEEEDEEDEDDEEEEEESDQEDDEEEEDSGSEVEIIEEVQGNGTLPPLQPSSDFVLQEHTHFLSALSEQEAAEFSIITAGAEMKMVEDDMEGEVVMVRLGSDDGGMDSDENVEHGSAFMELKPSTSLLVPVELVEGQDGLAHIAQVALPELQPAAVADPPQSDSHSSFTLMLNMDEYEVKEAMLPIENDAHSSDPSSQPQEENDKSDIITLDTDNMDPSQEEEMKNLDENNVDGLGAQTLQTDLQTENVATKLEAGDAREQKSQQFVLLQDHESASLSVYVPSTAVELPAAVHDNNSVAKAESVEEIEEESKSVFAEGEQKPQGNGPVDTGPESEENESVIERKVHEPETSAEPKAKSEENTERPRRRPRKKNADEKPVEQVLISESHADKKSVLQTPTSQKKKPPSTPTRRMTRRTVTFISTLPEAAEEPEEDGDAKTSRLVPVSPTRTSRKGRPVKENKIQTRTPRRSTRNTQPDPPEGEGDATSDTSVASTSKTVSPVRRSLRATSTRTSQRLQDGSKETSAAPEVETEEEMDQQDEVKNKKVAQRTSSKTPTPSKHRITQVNTPRRSSRRTGNSSEVESTPLQTLKEENEPEEPVVHPVKRTFRKTKSEALPSMKEKEEDEKEQPSRPVRASRQSGWNTLNLYPQVKIVPVSFPQSNRKTKQTIPEKIKGIENLSEPELHKNAGQKSSRRTTRSKLWDHPVEDLPLLDSPLEVDSETPVADALIKRLQDEKEKQEGGVATKMSRTRRTSTKLSVKQVSSQLPVLDLDEDKFNPDEHSYVYSPSRRQTRASRVVSPGPSEESATLVTRSRTRVKDVDPQDKISSEEDYTEMEKTTGVSKTRNTRKRPAKSKVVSAPLPVAEANLISPLPSPVDPLPRALKRIMEGEAPTTGRNVRHKRVLDTVFRKPVTRRKKL